MIRQLMKTCELTPSRHLYRIGLLACLLYLPDSDSYVHEALYLQGWHRVRAADGGCGCTALFPAAVIQQYWFYLCVFFVIATGMCFLETAANPYVTALGDPATASRRLNLAQSFNGLGAFVAAMFLSKLILSGQTYTRETLPADYAGDGRHTSMPRLS